MLMKLNNHDTAHGQIAFTGFYETELTTLVSRIARTEGGRLLDVGANYGYYSLMWCGLREDNSSLAFEASPKVIPELRGNLKLNRLESRVTLMELAVSDASGELCFDIGPEDQTGWGGISTQTQAGGNVVRVPTKRLDEMADHGNYTLLKIDCEGADAIVLRGAVRLLSEHRVRHVCYEENLPRMKTLGIRPGEAQALLRSHGYRCEPLDHLPNPTEFHAWIE
jgi:FkbM family methyltransferase